MKCFNHPNSESVGICKNCNKGICHECLTEVPNGIACTNSCIEEVTLVNQLIHKNTRSKNTAVGTYLRHALLYGLMGFTFILYEVLTKKALGFATIIGILFLVGAFFICLILKNRKIGHKCIITMFIDNYN